MKKQSPSPLSDETKRIYERQWRAFRAYFSGYEPLDLSSDQIVRYLAKKGGSRASLFRDKTVLRRYYGDLCRENPGRENPMASVKLPELTSGESEHLTPEEVQTILSFPFHGIKGIRDRALLILIAETGMSSGDAVRMNRADFDYENCAVIFKSAPRRRRATLSRDCAEALKTYETLSAAYGNTALFCNLEGGRLSRQALWKSVREYAEACGIRKNVSPRELGKRKNANKNTGKERL